ncbi:restriction endonuclease [Luteimonas notoginsengisoli]|uniref:Restriction endonuclease n=2 Tax=Luteimonas notoginsengisoli TaxID=1578200 RepID=A0ABV7URK0_9GAMM
MRKGFSSAMAREVSDPLWIPIRQGCRFDRLSLMLRRGDEYVVVQCKHWNAFQVTHTDVHQLLGIMVNESATGAILVSSGEFTRYARESAAKLGHVWLID